MLSLETLGNRICIIGCSSSGKSTLALKLAHKLQVPAYHLDILAHYPNTDWQRRPDSELIAAHAKILADDSWIIEGNYSVCMPERLAKSTSVIWLDPKPWSSVIRYIVRSLRHDAMRPGKLPGAKKELHFWLIKYILLSYPKNRKKYLGLLQNYKLPIIKITSMGQLQAYCQAWDLPCS